MRARRLARGLAVFAAIAAIAAAGPLGCGRAPITARAPSPPPDPAHSKAVGAGFYLTRPVDGERVPSNDRGEPVSPKVTQGFTGAPQTNDWWSSLIWQYDAGGKTNPWSQPMFAHPLAMQAGRSGLSIGYTTEPKVDARSYFFPYAADLVVGVQGLDAPETRVASYSDWAVTAAWADAAGGMTATLGHGLPFVYVRKQDERAALVALAAERTNAKVFHDGGEVLGVTVGGHHYGLFAPTGATWEREARGFASTLAGKDFFSVAVLPDDAPATLEVFRKHAYAFVKDTRVAWSYDEASATLSTRYVVTTELLEPGEGRVDTPLLCLYRHQWLHTARDAAFLPYSYVSPRGALKVLPGNDFTTTMIFHGVVPMLPVVGAASGSLRGLVDDVYQEGDLFPPSDQGLRDVYWNGKSFGRVATVAQLADQLGAARVRDQLVLALENQLANWFDGHAPFLFYYDHTWRTLIGLPSAYQSGQQLNDHHFHYGYFVFAAATIAALDPAWAGRDRWGAFVELLIKDVANWDRADERFPFLRHFDAWAGHSWANGPSLFVDGNNQESSSEAINFAQATILWGEVSGEKPIRDLGIFLYLHEIAATEQYWFDVDNQVFPAGFGPGVLGMVWSNGGKHDTWWDPNPVYVHGINWLPFTAASLYLGLAPGLAERSYAELVEESRGDPMQWRDLAWMFLALSDPDGAARALANNPRFAPELGNSHAWLHHWIHTLGTTGGPDATVTADVATAVVLRKGDVRTYVAWNPSQAPVTVKFSDGVSLAAPPHELVHAQHDVGPRR